MYLSLCNALSMVQFFKQILSNVIFQENTLYFSTIYEQFEKWFEKITCTVIYNLLHLQMSFILVLFEKTVLVLLKNLCTKCHLA